MSKFGKEMKKCHFLFIIHKKKIFPQFPFEPLILFFQIKTQTKIILTLELETCFESFQPIKRNKRKYEGDKSTVATKLSHGKKKKKNKDKPLQNISMLQSPQS